MQMPMEQPTDATRDPMHSPEAPQGAEIDPDELEITMNQYGVDEGIAETIIVARDQGYEEAEIAQFLQGGEQ